MIRHAVTRYEDFEEVFKSVQDGACELGVIPIENSLAGSIHQNYDLLLRHDLQIVGEYLLRVRHCLIALPGVDRGEIKKVISHPQALGQCAAYLRSWRQGGPARRAGGDEPLFPEDVPPEETAGLRRALAQAGVLATSAEVLEYLAWCRWFGARRPARVRRTTPGCVRWADSAPAGSVGRRAYPETAAC